MCECLPGQAKRKEPLARWPLTALDTSPTGTSADVSKGSQMSLLTWYVSTRQRACLTSWGLWSILLKFADLRASNCWTDRRQRASHPLQDSLTNGIIQAPNTIKCITTDGNQACCLQEHHCRKHRASGGPHGSAMCQSQTGAHPRIQALTMTTPSAFDLACCCTLQHANYLTHLLPSAVSIPYLQGFPDG